MGPKRKRNTVDQVENRPKRTSLRTAGVRAVKILNKRKASEQNNEDAKKIKQEVGNKTKAKKQNDAKGKLLKKECSKVTNIKCEISDSVDDMTAPKKLPQVKARKIKVERETPAVSHDEPDVKKIKEEANPRTNSSGVSNIKENKAIKKSPKLRATKKSASEVVSKAVTHSTETPKKEQDSDSSSSESDWEEVLDDVSEQDINDYKPEIPKEGVEITLEGPKVVRKRERKAFDMMGFIRLQINRKKKERQLAVHQVHLLCLLARGLYINNILSCDDVKAIALSLIPIELLNLKVSTLNAEHVRKLLSWFRETFVIQSNFRRLVDVKRMILRCFEYRKAPSSFEFNMMFVAVARTLKLNARLCVSFYPVSHKPTDLLKKPKSLEAKDEKSKSCEGSVHDPSTSKLSSTATPKETPKILRAVKSSSKKTTTKNKSKTKITPDVKGGNAEKKAGTRNMPKRSSTPKTRYIPSSEDNDDSDEDFEDSKSESSEEDKRKKRKQSSKKSITPTSHKKSSSVKNRKILSSEGSPEPNEKEQGIECWVEIYSTAEKKWICVECSENICQKPYDIERAATQPVTYIVAFDNNSYFKDVTKRYCAQWMTFTRKLRVVPEWWEETLEPFLPPDTKQDREEESLMEANLLRKPLPLTINEYKNHPLYALKRHLLKFEAIYPPDAPTVGFIRKEPVYARDCVHKLHSRETWVKEARLVRVNEQPYKIVKARPKWDRVSGEMKTDLPLELFGFWQTEKYMPPIAWNGKVPRNEYGNVELFKPCMLPVGTVHLRNPGLNRVAKKLGIDCSPAVVGFDGHKGSIHPVFDGFVVCEEFKDTLLAAWEEEQQNIRKREEEKYNKRVYGNWKRLIKGLLIRERIRVKYAVD